MHDNSSSSNKRQIGLFALTMLAIVSVDSLRNISIAAQYGPSLLIFYGFAVLTFFFPLAFITAKLATEYPVTGGSFVWIEKAFGKKLGYASIWLQWIYNMIWYPTIFVFISSTLANLIHPGLEQNKTFVLTISLAFFWLLTQVHSFGMRATGWVGIVGALVGTLVPMFTIIGLGMIWLLGGHPSATPLEWNTVLPNTHDFKNLAYFSNILFSLLGLEVIAMHAGNVKNPVRNYPRALLVSAIVIPATLALSALSLCIILPTEKISLVNGTMEVFTLFFAAWHFSIGATLAGICVIAGGLAIASSWMIGLAKGFHTALVSTGHIPWGHRLNRNGVPSRILFVQGILYSVLLSAFLFFGSINTSYWMLSALTAQFALLYYVLFFMAAFKLLRKKKGLLTNRWVSIPVVVASLTCIGGLLAGFLPPDEIPSGKILYYEIFLIAGIALMAFLPGLVIRRWR